MAEIDSLFSYLLDKGGSDLHLAAGVMPKIRNSGALEEVSNKDPTTQAEMQVLLKQITTDSEWASYLETWELDFAYSLEGVGRFRANYFVRHGGFGAVFRIIPEEILTLEQLNMPTAVRGLAHTNSGLVLVTGPTGSGKSTTLAAIINEINETYCRHIITIEDPVEFVHPNKKSVMVQREVGQDSSSFSLAMRAALRQDPDIIVVGEMRDVETISLALTAAESGTLVFGTLHTNSAIKTIDRLIDAFPADRQEQARLSLSEALTAVVAQLLLKKKGGGRCAINEILLKTRALPNIIRIGNTSTLYSVLQSGKKEGMQSMDDALFEALREERIDAMAAYVKAREKRRFVSFLTPEEQQGLEAP